MARLPGRAVGFWLVANLAMVAIGLQDAWELFGFGTVGSLFVDLNYVLSAIECTRMGIDVVVANPCDVLGRRFIYPPAWLDLAVFPLAGADTRWLGVLLGAAFLALVAWVLRPRGPVAWTVGLLLILSPTTVYLVERGNVDAILFLLTTAVLATSARGLEAWRLVAMCGAVVATLLKVYPVVLFLVIAPSLQLERRKFFGYLIATTAVGLAYLVFHWQEVLRFISGVPSQNSLAMFGASVLPWSIELITRGTLPTVLSHPVALAGLFFVFAAGLALIVESKKTLRIDEVSRGARFFAGGGLVLVFCFLTGTHVAYRLVYVILMIPFLFEMVLAGRSAVARWLGGYLLFWCILTCWNLLFVVTLVNHLTSLDTVRAVEAFVPWLDAYIMFYQGATWVALAAVAVQATHVIHRVQVPIGRPCQMVSESATT